MAETDSPPSEQAASLVRSQSDPVTWAASCSPNEMLPLLQSGSAEILHALLRNSRFGEREALLLLARNDLPRSVIEDFAERKIFTNSYAARLALSRNSQTPLRLALENLKFLYIFDLVSISLIPALHPEIKRTAEELILKQNVKLTVGQRITLAKRSSARVAASLLTGSNQQIMSAVLDNPRLTESALLGVLHQSEANDRLIDAIASHKRWSLRYDIRIALLRLSSITTARALVLIKGLKVADLQQLATDPAVRTELKDYLAKVARTNTLPKE